MHVNQVIINRFFCSLLFPIIINWICWVFVHVVLKWIKFGINLYWFTVFIMLFLAHTIIFSFWSSKSFPQIWIWKLMNLILMLTNIYIYMRWYWDGLARKKYKISWKKEKKYLLNMFRPILSSGIKLIDSYYSCFIPRMQPKYISKALKMKLCHIKIIIL